MKLKSTPSPIVIAELLGAALRPGKSRDTKPMTKEKIRRRHGDFLCLCGNNPIAEGFFPCSPLGEIVDPTPDAWPKPLYRCDSCGRIINQDTLEVEGKAIINQSN